MRIKGFQFIFLLAMKERINANGLSNNNIYSEQFISNMKRNEYRQVMERVL